MTPETTLGVILAGGRSRRMGGTDKALCLLNGQPLLMHTVERLNPQVSSLIINANVDVAAINSLNVEVVTDCVGGFAGPLAGVLTGLIHAKQHSHAKYIVTVSVDTPFIPLDLVSRLYKAINAEQTQIACASSNGRIHPVIALWSVDLLDDLTTALTVAHIHKVERFVKHHKYSIVEFASNPIDPFFNVNTPDDLIVAHDLLKSS